MNFIACISCISGHIWNCPHLCHIFSPYNSDDSMEGNEKSEKRKLLESWLNKIMKIKISDGRTLIGSFLCTDQDRNIILGSCQEFVGSSGKYHCF